MSIISNYSCLQSKAIIILVLIAYFTNNQCLNYDLGDVYPNISSSYCNSILIWPIMNTTFSSANKYDLIAYNNYQNLYKNYYLPGLVDIDCLGIAKTFFCADAYPTCSRDPLTEYNQICSWMCQLFSVRCGQKNQFYTSICLGQKKQSSSNCSWNSTLLISFCWIVLIFIF